jgi:hypothetical protein
MRAIDSTATVYAVTVESMARQETADDTDIAQAG